MTSQLGLSFDAPRAEEVLPPGARVVIRDEEWIVRGVHRSSVGGTAVEVIGLSELVRNQSAVFLSRIDPVQRLHPEATALVDDPTPGFRRSRLYLESLLRRTPPTDEKLYLGHHAAADSLPYQLEPAARALRLPRARILIADDVGLGKTIEVGILLAELIRRGQGRRILVVTLKSLLGQFQRELWHRFAVPLVALDSTGIERMQARIPATTNPFHVYDRVIVSVDTLKKDARYRRFLERARWDVVVVDECQNVAVRGAGARRSQRAKLASLLAETCDALVLTSATPHDGTPESFASLVNLLDPTAIADASHYQRDDVKALFVRRFKKDVADQVRSQFTARLPPRLETVSASPEEDAVFQALSTASFPTLDRGRSKANPLFRTVLLKAFLSSPVACRATLDERAKTLAPRSDDDAIEDRALLSRIGSLVDAVTFEASWPKYAKLLAWLREAGWTGRGALGERVVIFSERVDTLKALRDRLVSDLGIDKRPDAVALFFGALKDTEQDEIVRDFGVEDGKTRILLASDAASEGINLHYFCHRLVHFDIPWSLITLEQRNGRIDRFGQTHAPDLRYLLTRPTDPTLQGDLRVLERLVERERYVHENLGDAAWLMRCFDPAKEESRIAEAIETKADPVSVLPEAVVNPGDDILAMLTGPVEAPPAAPTVPLGEVRSLYADDLMFARAAFEEVGDEAPYRPEFHDEARGFVLTPSPQIEQLYDRTPARRKRHSPVKLTVDRGRVTSSIERARSRKDQSPEWELFWPLHPLADWLCDRVLTGFARHEAPVLEVSRGLAPNEAAYVYQGIYANQRSEPRIVAWFAVVTRGSEMRVVPFDALVRDTGLDGTLSNAAAAHRVSELQAKVPETVRAAEAHMATLRRARNDEMHPRLRDESLRIKRWSDAVLDAIESEENGLGRAPRADEARRFAERKAAVERIEKARRAWVDEGLRTVDAPSLRLAAVLVTKESRA